MGVTDFLLLSCLGFAITAHAQDCAVPVGGPNMDLKHEDSKKDTFASGDKATFECDPGYYSAGGSSSITCTAGSWSTVSLKCERKNCTSPGELSNGKTNYTAVVFFRDHIVITCNEGYRLVGYDTITCGADGWSNKLPRCEAQDCAVPVGGPNMHLKGEDILKDTFASGDRATFECDTGYSSAGGSSSITCTASSWSTVSLKCERKNCGEPGELPNGQIHYPKQNLFGDHIEITCDEGYRLVGKSTITCGAEGWMDRLPRCEVATCDEAPQVKDATFTPHKEPYDFGDVVRYSCQQGLTLNGAASISCSDDGTFKPDPPTCIKVQCEDLDIPDLDWISGSRPPHGYMATVTYRCRTGFKMVGQPTLTCDINSQWSPGLPRCEKVICNRPPLVANGSFSPVKEVYDYSNAVQYSCQNGFRLDGSESASCSDDGTFKPAPPTCTMMTCNRPLPLEHGTFSPVKEVYKYEDVVEYSCQNGFKLSGSKSVSCSDDGTFKPDPPTCTKSHTPPAPGIFCEEPQVENGHLTHDARPPYRLNDKVTFKCSSLHYMDGEPTLTCQADGQWSAAPPKCNTNVGGVVGVVFVGIAGAAALIYAVLCCCGIVPPLKKKNRQEHLVEEDATEAEEEVALLDGASLKEHPPGNGQASGEGHRGQVARKRFRK